MSDKKFTSANQDISITGAAKPKIDAKALLGGMTKDVKRRWLFVMLALGAAMVLISTWMSSPSAPPTPVKKPASVVETSPKGLSSQNDWKSQTGAELQDLRKTLSDSQTAQRELLSQLEALRTDMRNIQKGPPNSAQQQPQQPSLTLSIPPPPQAPAILSPSTVSSAPPPPPAPGSFNNGTVRPTVPATNAVKRSPARSFAPPVSVDAAAQQQGAVVEEMVANERKGFLPAGSFAAATLISGVEAFTGGTAQQQPQPLVIRIDANAVLPNAARYQIKGCHVLASVWGDMSSERVFGRLATLTCVDSANRLVLSEEVEGVLVDSDGKNGIRGALQDRQGAKLARSLVAGFAQGLSSAFGAAQSTTQSTAFGMTTAMVGSNATRAGAYQGASTAANQLADFYLKQAEATMPVIAVDAGRKVSVMFTKSKPLKFETTDTYRVKAKEKLMVERPGN